MLEDRSRSNLPSLSPLASTAGADAEALSANSVTEFAIVSLSPLPSDTQFGPELSSRPASNCVSSGIEGPGSIPDAISRRGARPEAVTKPFSQKTKISGIVKN
jgi:hypothetical protein